MSGTSARALEFSLPVEARSPPQVGEIRLCQCTRGQKQSQSCESGRLKRLTDRYVYLRIPLVAAPAQVEAQRNAQIPANATAVTTDHITPLGLAHPAPDAGAVPEQDQTRGTGG